MIKSLVVYYSLGGNTEVLADKIKENLSSQGQEYDVLVLGKDTNYESVNIEAYELVFIGSPTYGKGNTPNYVSDYLRYIVKHNNFKLPKFSVFGTGDTQWKHYARAVDEITYHLSKKTDVIRKLKIEQRPVSKRQLNEIKNYVDESLRRI